MVCPLIRWYVLLSDGMSSYPMQMVCPLIPPRLTPGAGNTPAQEILISTISIESISIERIKSYELKHVCISSDTYMKDPNPTVLENIPGPRSSVLLCVAVLCFTVAHCNTLPHTAMRYHGLHSHTLPDTAAHNHAMQNTAAHCNTSRSRRKGHGARL